MALQPKAGNAPCLRRMLMRLFPTPSKNVLRRIIVTTSLFVTPIIFTACGSPGSLMGNPSRQVPPTVDQVSAPSSSSSRPSSSSSGSTNTTTTPPVVLFNRTGTDSDVAAVESVLNRLKLSYATANSSQLNAMTESRLKAHKLFIVPGGTRSRSGTIFQKQRPAEFEALGSGLPTD
jgi:hypothetical protein